MTNTQIDHLPDDNEQPLFTFKQSLFLIFWFLLCVIILYIAMSFPFAHINQNSSAYDFVISNHNLIKQWLLNSSVVLTTIIMMMRVKIRLINTNNNEWLSSYLGFHEPNWRFFWLWTAIFCILGWITWNTNYINHPQAQNIQQDVLQYGLWVNIFNILLIAPICEEIFFRGILWTAIHDSTNSEKTAFLISSLLFAAAHMNFPYMVQYIVISWIMVRARTVGGSLFFAIWLHFLHNFFIFIKALMFFN